MSISQSLTDTQELLAAAEAELLKLQRYRELRDAAALDPDKIECSLVAISQLEETQEEIDQLKADRDRLEIQSGHMYGWIMRGRTRAQVEMIVSGDWRKWKPRTIRRKLKRRWP